MGEIRSWTLDEHVRGPVCPHWLRHSLVCSLGFLMMTMDATVVNIILPHVQKTFALADSDRQWIITAYSVMMGASLALGGRAVDYVGARRALIVGALGFGVFSGATGLAGSAATMIACRILQAVFGALLAPATLSILNELTLDRVGRARSFAIYGAVSALGGPMGMLLGGVVTEQFSWRPCLFINTILGLAVALLGYARLPALPGRTRVKRFDFPGALLLASGVGLILIGMSRLGAPALEIAGIALGNTALLGIGVAALCLFLLVESRALSPIVPLDVFTRNRRGVTFLGLGLVAGAFMGVAVLMSFFVQQVLGYSPAMAGLALLPSTIGSIIGPALTGVLVPKLGAKRVWLMGVANLFVAGLILASANAGSDYFTVILPGDFLAGLGLGLSLMPSSNILLFGIPHEESGVASGLSNATIQISASIAVTAFNSLFVAFSGAPGQLAGQDAIRGYEAAFLSETAVALVAGALVLFLIRDMPEPRAAADHGPVIVGSQGSRGKAD